MFVDVLICSVVCWPGVLEDVPVVPNEVVVCCGSVLGDVLVVVGEVPDCVDVVPTVDEALHL